jgi:hypothetical protein
MQVPYNHQDREWIQTQLGIKRKLEGNSLADIFEQFKKSENLEDSDLESNKNHEQRIHDNEQEVEATYWKDIGGHEDVKVRFSFVFL